MMNTGSNVKLYDVNINGYNHITTVKAFVDRLCSAGCFRFAELNRVQKCAIVHQGFKNYKYAHIWGVKNSKI